MRIQRDIGTSTNFQSGLNRKILFREIFTSPKRQERIFSENYGIETDFNKNKSVAFANASCLDIFKELLAKFKKDILMPPSINVYNKEKLIEKGSADNFCIPDTKSVLKDDYPFPGRSLFFRDYKSLEQVDSIVETQFKNHETSSSHFLAPFIHEWIHSLQLDNLYHKYGYGGTCEYLRHQYPKKPEKITGYEIIKNLTDKHLSDAENEIVYEELGEYATKPLNQYFEVYSEALTKYICNSLSGTKLVSNPLEHFEKSPKEFQEIFNKVRNLEINPNN